MILSRRRFGLSQGTNSLVIAIGAGLAFGAYMVLADGLLFRSIIPVVQFDEMPVLSRVAYLTPYIVLEELMYRLALMSILAWAITSITGKQDWCYWTAITVTALVIYPLAHLAYLKTLPPVPLTVVREVVLHGFAGILWGWLYWRHGFLACITGHVASHVTLNLMPLSSS